MKLFKLSEQVVKTCTLQQVAVLSSISFYRNDSTNTAFRFQNQIANELNISVSQVERIVASLKEANVFSKIDRVKVEKNFKNVYTFSNIDNHFILVNKDIFNRSLTNLEIGFLIKVKAISFDNGMSVNFSKEKIASILGIGETKLNSLIKSLSSKNLVKYENCVLTLTNDLFIDNSKKALSIKRRSIRNNHYLETLKEMYANACAARVENIELDKAHQQIIYYFENKEQIKNTINLMKYILTGTKYIKRDKQDFEI